MSERLLDLSLREVSEKFDGPEEFAEAIVEEKKEEFEERGMPLSDEDAEDLYEVYMDSIKEDEIWG